MQILTLGKNDDEEQCKKYICYECRNGITDSFYWM